ncbi:MAG: glycosyltransferase involved in cell wall biosynthesis [Polaribacter sp.]|jgi:glycosyltransferase involved in cell wall biosynthesis
MISKKDIYICVPVFNEEQVIFQVIKNIRKRGYEQIFIINDGSTDHSAKEAERAGATVIQHLVNRGAGAAAQTAIVLARKRGFKYLLMMDGDGQHCPDDIPSLSTTLLSSRSDIVIGSRFLKDFSNMPNIRKGYNRIANQLTNLFCNNSYTDTQSGYRLLNRNAIETLNLTLDGFSFCSEMLILSERAGLEITEAPVKTLYSDYSLQKGQNFLSGVSTAWDLIRKIIFR